MASWASIKDAVDTRRGLRNPEKRRLWLGQQADRIEPDDADFRPPLQLHAELPAVAPAQSAQPPCSEMPPEDEAVEDRAASQAASELLRQRIELLERERADLLAELDARRREVGELHALLQCALQQRPPEPAATPQPEQSIEPTAARRERWGWLREWFTPPDEVLKSAD